MSGVLLDYNPTTGVEEWYVDDDSDVATVHSRQRVDKILDRNKFLEAEGKNMSADKSLHWYASIPLTVIMQWIQESGINLMALPSREFAAFCDRKVKDPDWRYLKVSSII